MLLAAVRFSSCENDDDDLYDTLTGRVWAGDLGFYQDGYCLLYTSPRRASVFVGQTEGCRTKTQLATIWRWEKAATKNL